MVLPHLPLSLSLSLSSLSLSLSPLPSLSHISLSPPSSFSLSSLSSSLPSLLSLPLSPPLFSLPPRSYKDHILHHPVVSPIITGPLLLSITLYTTPDKSFSLTRKKQVPSQNLPCRDKSCIIQNFRSQSAIIHYYVHGTILHTSVTKRVPPPPHLNVDSRIQ